MSQEHIDFMLSKIPRGRFLEVGEAAEMIAFKHSVFALPFAWAISTAWGSIGLLVGAALALLAGLWASHVLLQHSRVKDPRWIVIDEAAGTFLAVIGLSFWPAVIAWVVFRIADIKKRWAPGVEAADRYAALAAQFAALRERYASGG